MMTGTSYVERFAVRGLLSPAQCPQLTVTLAPGHEQSQTLFSKGLSLYSCDCPLEEWDLERIRAFSTLECPARSGRFCPYCLVIQSDVGRAGTGLQRGEDHLRL